MVFEFLSELAWVWGQSLHQTELKPDKDICVPCIPTSLKRCPFQQGFASFAGSALQYAGKEIKILLVWENFSWFHLGFNNISLNYRIISSTLRRCTGTWHPVVWHYTGVPCHWGHSCGLNSSAQVILKNSSACTHFFFPGECMQNRDNLAHLPESRWHLQTLSVYQMLFFRSSVPGWQHRTSWCYL